jgi:hypothetical protein
VHSSTFSAVAKGLQLYTCPYLSILVHMNMINRLLLLLLLLLLQD